MSSDESSDDPTEAYYDSTSCASEEDLLPFALKPEDLDKGLREQAAMDAFRKFKNSKIFELSLHDFALLEDYTIFEFDNEHIGGICWRISVDRQDYEGVEYLDLSILRGRFHHLPLHRHCLVSIVNHQDSSQNAEKLKIGSAEETNEYKKMIRRDMVLAPGSGFLNDGALTIRVEMRIDYFMELNGVRVFNIYDPFDNCIAFYSQPWLDRPYFGNKQVIMHHCAEFRDRIAAGETSFLVTSPAGFFGDFLHQIHGVRYVDKSITIDNYTKNSRYFKTAADPQHVRLFYPDLKKRPELDTVSCKFVKQRLESAKSLMDMRGLIRIWEIEEMNLEMMKAAARKFFSFAEDYNSRFTIRLGVQPTGSKGKSKQRPKSFVRRALTKFKL